MGDVINFLIHSEVTDLDVVRDYLLSVLDVAHDPKKVRERVADALDFVEGES